ncbi:Retinoblastoma-associated protein [Trichoplax sp. H2]|nr:Retinoblastoma-associated protein [Trichoplax sp. H2]|eukprot:RDD47677.1 Retinoblastoma-associated protein [Trichoplax sp. H2]
MMASSLAVTHCANNANNDEDSSYTDQTIRDLFKDLHSNLNITDPLVLEEGWNMWKIISETFKIVKNDISQWVCAINYIAIYTARMSSKASILKPIPKVLNHLMAARINILDFIDKLQKLGEIISVENHAAKKQIYLLSRKYLIDAALFAKCDLLIELVFRKDIDKSIHKFKDLLDNPRSYIWLLFLVAKDSLLKDPELYIAYYLLICCVNHLAKSVPSSFIKENYRTLIGTDTESVSHLIYDDKIAILFETVDFMKLKNIFIINFGQQVSSEILRKLCEDLHVQYEGVRDFHNNCWTRFQVTGSSILNPLKIDNLNREYEAAFIKNGDFDERAFLDESIFDSMLKPKSTGKEDRGSYRKDPPPTPVKSTMKSIANLLALLTSTDTTPGSLLCDYFKKCCPNPFDSILARLERYRDVFVQKYAKQTSSAYSSISDKYFDLAKRLYFRVLENMLKGEQRRLGNSDFSVLLNHDVFHSSLLACSLEVVLFTYNSPHTSNSNKYGYEFSFPWILDILDIKAYHFGKVIESFIRSELSLDNNLVQHLNFIESMILESLAWRASSPLYAALESSKIDLRYRQLVTENKTEVAGSLLETCLSPVKKSHTSEKQSCGDETQKKLHSVDLFYRKVFQLAYLRLKNLCDALKIDEKTINRTWTCYHYALTYKTKLFMDRHIDQVMLCCTYAVCKVMQKEIQFKEIIHHYKSLFGRSSSVCRNVLLLSNQYGTIIAFYNQIFICEMKEFVLKLSSVNAALQLSPIPTYNSRSPRSDGVGKRIPWVSNVYLSPLKRKDILTPRSKALYCFGDALESSRKLSEINEIVHKGSMKSSKRLKFDDTTVTADVDVTSRCAEARPGLSNLDQDENPTDNPTNNYKAVMLENRLADFEDFRFVFSASDRLSVNQQK